MEEIDLKNSLERISSNFPNRIIKIEDFILNNFHKEQLEIIISKDFSSFTTHPIEIDLEKTIINFSYEITNSKTL